MFIERTKNVKKNRHLALARDKSGSVGIIFGLAFLPVMLMMGATVDYGRAAAASSHIQQSADSAALLVANQPGLTQPQRQTLAANAVMTNLGQLASTLNVTITETEPSIGVYNVAVSGALPTAVMQIAQMPAIPLSRQARAMMKTSSIWGGGATCVLSLSESAVDSFWDNGTATVNLPNCDIVVNSSNGGALDVNGNANLTAHQILVRGGVTTSSFSRITTTATPSVALGGLFCTGCSSGVAPMPGPSMIDPYASVIQMPPQAANACDYQNTSAQGRTTLSPGVYCGGISINANANVTLTHGLYIIKGGSLTVNGQASVQDDGQGATLVFTCERPGACNDANNIAQATINGGATVNVSAPPAGASHGIPGMVIYGDSSMPLGTVFKLTGGSTQAFSGAVYLPQAALNFSGGASSTTGCIQIVANTVKFVGNSNLAIDSSCGSLVMVSFGLSTQTAVALIK